MSVTRRGVLGSALGADLHDAAVRFVATYRDRSGGGGGRMPEEREISTAQLRRLVSLAESIGPKEVVRFADHQKKRSTQSSAAFWSMVEKVARGDDPAVAAVAARADAQGVSGRALLYEFFDLVAVELGYVRSLGATG